MTWFAVSIGLSLLVGVLAGSVGSPSLITWLVPALALALSSAFYVSLWFSFVDNFGSPDDDAPASTPPSGDG